MSDLIKPIVDMFEFSNMSVSVALADLSNDDAGWRACGGQGSSASYITGHLLSTRLAVLQLLGRDVENPYEELFAHGKPARDGDDYPPIAELKTQWKEQAGRFREVLEELTDDDVLRDAPEGFPITDQTIRGVLQFFAWHEAYHLGQIGLLRRERGYPSVQARIHEHLSATA